MKRSPLILCLIAVICLLSVCDSEAAVTRSRSLCRSGQCTGSAGSVQRVTQTSRTTTTVRTRRTR